MMHDRIRFRFAKTTLARCSNPSNGCCTLLLVTALTSIEIEHLSDRVARAVAYSCSSSMGTSIRQRQQ